MIRALDTLSFILCLAGWLLLGIFGTWRETAPFWLGAPLLWAAALCGLFTLHWGLRGRLSRTCLVSVVLFISYILWRALTSDVAYLARQDVLFGATAFIGWVLTSARYETPRRRFALIFVWSVLILGNLGMGLYQEFSDPSATPLKGFGFTRNFKDAVFAGFFPNSNHLCGFLELTAFIVLGLALFGRIHSFVRVLCGLVFIAASVAVAMTTSRGGFIVYISGALVFGIIGTTLRLSRKWHHRRAGTQLTGMVFAGMAVLGLGLGLLAWSQLKSKFGEGQVFGDGDLNGRAQMWDRAQSQWSESPLIGTGARSYEYYERSYRTLASRWITESDVDLDAVFAHNDWIQLLADYGLTGLVLAVLVLAAHVWKAIAFLSADSRAAAAEGKLFTDCRGAIVMGALSGLLAFALHCGADFHMHIGVNAVLAGAVLGLIANPGQPVFAARRAAAEEQPQRVERGIAGLAAAAPAAVFLWFSFPWATGDIQFRLGLRTFNQGAESIDDALTALGKMKDSADADPKNYQAWAHLGFAHALCIEFLPGRDEDKMPLLQKSLDCYLKAHALYPQNGDYAAVIGRTLDRMHRPEEAEAWFLTALEWAGGSRRIHEFYGDHLMRGMRNYEKALEHYWPVLHRYSGANRARLDSKIKHCTALLRKQQATPAPPPAP